MAKLYSQYFSGTQFTAGIITGSTLGISGLNPIVDRLNSITTEDNLVIGSVVSGTSTVLYTSGINCSAGYLILENRTANPTSPQSGRIWLRTDI